MSSYSTQGSTDYIGIGKQTNVSAAAATLKYVRYRSSNPLEHNIENNPERQGGEGMGVTDIWMGARSIGGNIEAVARPDLTMALLKYHLGAEVSGANLSAAGAVSGTVTHCFYPSASIPYVTVEVNRAESTVNQQGIGCLVPTFSLKGEPASPISWTATIAGAYNVTGTTAADTATYETDIPWQQGATTFAAIVPTSGASISGSTTLQNWSFESKYDIDEDVRTNRLYVEEIPVLNYGCDIDLSIRYENANLYRQFTYGDSVAQSAALASAFASASFSVDMQYGMGGPTARRLYVNFPSLYIVDCKLDDMDPDGKTMYISLAAMAYNVQRNMSAMVNISGWNATSGMY